MFPVDDRSYPTLHLLWDGALGLYVTRPFLPLDEKASMELCEKSAEITAKLPRSKLEELEHSQPFEWAIESSDIAKNFCYKEISYGEKPSKEYIRKGRLICKRRLVLAGYRLADILNDTLSENL